jgi:hypothetical protein
MNLADILLPENPYRRPAGAEKAERAENQQWQGLQSPPVGAERGGKVAEPEVVRPNPPAGAESETPAITEFPPNPPNPPARLAEIEKPLPLSREYMLAQGVRMTADDLAFLRWHLPRDTAGRNDAIRRYIAIWLEAMADEPVAQRKQNRGAFAANTWLRELAQ